MKKFTALALLSIAIISCKKDTKTITKTDPKTGKTVTVEVPAGNADSTKTVQENPAIKDSLGVYRQTFRLEKGKTYPFTTRQKQVMSITAPDGKSQGGSSESTDEVQFTVDDFSNNVYDITINFVSKSSSQTGNGKTISIDTRQAAPKDAALKQEWTMQKALTGNQLKMKMDDHGKIISITGFDAVYSKISKTLEGLTKDKKAIAGMVANLKQGFNEKMLKDQFSKNILVLPTKGAKIGEKWTKTENMSADGKVKLTTTYALKGVENGIATVTVNAGIPYKSQKQNQGNATHTLSSELSQTGTILLDENSGWIKSQTINVKTTQKESISDGKQTQSVSSVNTSTITVNP